jgi:peptidoglycan/LPS O-acetylase OafA/YrhL
VRHCGQVTLVLPVLSAASVAGAVLVAGPAWQDLFAGTLFPVFAAFAVAAVAGSEPAPELQTSVACPYWTTMARRLAVSGAAVTAGAVLLVVVLAVAATGHDPMWTFARAWCSAMFLGGVAAAAGARLRSVSGASTVVLAAWLGQLFVLGRLLHSPASELAVPLVAAATLVAMALRRWNTPERLAVASPGRAATS